MLFKKNELADKELLYVCVKFGAAHLSAGLKKR